MIARSFWLLNALFVLIAVHLAVVLYLPGIMLQRNINRLSTNATSNQFFLADPTLQSSLLPTATPEDIVGLCLVNVSSGKVVLSAQLPNQLWSLMVYDNSGQQVYGINDIDAGSAGFTVELSKSKGLLEQLTGTAEPDDVGTIRNIGWRAQLAQNTALAVLWLPVPDSNRRAALEAAIRNVSCQVK